MPIRLALTGSFGAAGENAALPAGGNVVVKSMQVPYTFLYQVVQLSGPVQALSRGDKKAFMSALELSMGSAYEEFRLGANFFLYGFGQGQIGRVASGGVSGNVITLTDDIFTASYFYENQKLDSYTSAGVAHDTGTGALTVTDVDLVNRKLTVNGLVNTAASDYLYISGSKGLAPNGLLGAVDDSTYVDVYMNIQRTAVGNKKWKSYVTSAVAGQTPAIFGNSTRGAISTDQIQNLMDQQRVRAGQGRSVDQLLSDLGVRRMYFNSLAPDRRFDGANFTIFDGGWEELKYSNGDKTVPWMGDELCPRYTLFALHFGHAIQPKGHKVDKIAEEEIFAIYQDTEPDWDKSTGSITKQIYSGSSFVDAIGSYMKWYMNAATARPNDHARLDDVAES